MRLRLVGKDRMKSEVAGYAGERSLYVVVGICILILTVLQLSTSSGIESRERTHYPCTNLTPSPH